jgi:hypothetical protein
MVKKTGLPEKKTVGRPKLTGPVNKQVIYNLASTHAMEALRRLVVLMYSENEPVAMGAAKTILAKCIPDLKSTEMSGEVGLKLIHVINLPVEKLDGKVQRHLESTSGASDRSADKN